MLNKNRFVNKNRFSENAHCALRKFGPLKRPCSGAGDIGCERPPMIIDAENGLDIDGFKAAAENVYDYFAEDWGDMPDLIRAVQP